MLRDDDRDEADPSEVQPTDNASATPVDLDRLDEAQDDAPAGDA